ncbi:hypothetical protein [Vulcanisaeta moutnovskia]|nr:hypothetical protein [Vulcanisaeta moutnovskia]
MPRQQDGELIIDKPYTITPSSLQHRPSTKPMAVYRLTNSQGA